MTTKADKILIILTIGISLLLMIKMSNKFNNTEKKIAIIKLDGQEYERVEIKPNMEAKKIEVKSNFGYNLVEVDSSGARVLEASCKDKLDVKFGNISSVGEIIVCLPNRVTVEIQADMPDSEVDIISR